MSHSTTSHHDQLARTETEGDEQPSTIASGSSSTRTSNGGSGLVMQIILRRDLLTVHKWPVGPLLAQSAHAATAVLHKYHNHPDVMAYLEGWEGMRKVVLEVPDESALRTITTRLEGMTNPIPYHLWIEQPENTPTALALVPNKRPKALKKILDEVGAQMWR